MERKLSNGCQTFEWALAKHVFKADNIRQSPLDLFTHTHGNTSTARELFFTHTYNTHKAWQPPIHNLLVYQPEGVCVSAVCDLCFRMRTYTSDTHMHQQDNIIKSECSDCRLQNAHFQMLWRRATPRFSTGNWSRSSGFCVWVCMCMCNQHTMRHAQQCRHKQTCWHEMSKTGPSWRMIQRPREEEGRTRGEDREDKLLLLAFENVMCEWAVKRKQKQSYACRFPRLPPPVHLPYFPPPHQSIIHSHPSYSKWPNTYSLLGWVRLWMSRWGCCWLVSCQTKTEKSRWKVI